MTMATASMQDILDVGLAHSSPTVQQYAKGLSNMFGKRGYKERHLEALPGDLNSYIDIAPKYSKKNVELNTRISGWGIKPATYRQYQSDGRRMIEFYHGDLQARAARRQRQDGFARLQSLLAELVDARLVDGRRTGHLPKLVDFARARAWDVTELTRDRVVDLRQDCLSSDQWYRIRQAAGFLDDLHRFPTLRFVLPKEQIGCLKGIKRIDTDLPEFLALEAEQWVQEATIEYLDIFTEEATREATAKELSDGSKGIYTAAMRRYIHTAGEFTDLYQTNGLTALFSPSLIERVLTTLSKKSGTPGYLAPRSLYSYAVKLKLTLLTRNMRAEADLIEQLIRSLPSLIEGQNASEKMSTKTERWCENLLADPGKMELFDTQHFLYAEKARSILQIAKIEGIDLAAFARSPQAQPLTIEQMRLAKRLLSDARTFGVCAAFAAIELEGAPFRKANVLEDLKMTGPYQTFFDHRNDATHPRMELRIPNELLKNGEAMTKRNQYLPPCIFERNGLGSDAYAILSFFLSEIRPLFGGAMHSDLVFPAIEPVDKPLVMQTFDSWFARCSSAIGLPMTPHNFRHGVCSVELYHDPSCYPELEAVTGDTVPTLRRYYAFIDRARQRRAIQQKRYDRRAERARQAASSAQQVA